MVNRIGAKLAAALAGAALLALGAGAAEARTFVSVGVGVPLYAPYYYPPPVYYAPPVVYAPPPVVYSPPPVVYSAPTYVQQPAQTWYYCDNPAGYYPYVSSCPTAWRQVPATPGQQPPAPSSR
jgi:hypothetical protein